MMEVAGMIAVISCSLAVVVIAVNIVHEEFKK